jgi:hypothetical protein
MIVVQKRFLECLQFARIDRRVIFWMIAEPAVKRDSPRHAQKAKGEEDPLIMQSKSHLAVSTSREHPTDEQRSEGPTPARTEPEHALCFDPFGGRKPIRESLGDVWKTSRFSHSKKEAANHE